MRQHWDRFADDDYVFYIAGSQRGKNKEEFFASACQVVEEAMGWLSSDVARERVLEIGCGVGRVCSHFARFFTRVDGVDISEAMVAKANQQGLPDNIIFSTVTGNDLSLFKDRSFDPVFSYLVMQHIPETEVISSYLREVTRVMSWNGRVMLQFDTRPENAFVNAYKALPDFLLPRSHRRYIRRYRRRAESVRQLFLGAELEVLDEKQADTESHFFLLQRST